MPDPILWGVMAGTLNFVPYVGPLVAILKIVSDQIDVLRPPAEFLGA